MTSKFKFVLGAIAVWAAGFVPAHAQDYPTKPVKVVIPFAAGGGTDVVGRIVAQDLSQRLNQTFFVENKPGAAAQLGTDMVAKSTPDGYTLLWTVTDGLSILPAVKSSVPYRIPEDFAFIAGAVQLQFAVSVNSKVPVKTMAELVAYAKANPGKLNYGSAGIGSAPHLGIALMNIAAGLDMVHVPFNGTGPAAQALTSGTVDLALITTQQAKPYVESGNIRVLAVTGTKRDGVLPEVPTLKETGVDVSTVVAYGLSAPAGTPEPVLAKLRQAISATMQDKALVDRLKGLGYETDLQLGDAYRNFIIKDLEQWRAVAKAANIRIDK